MQDKRLRNRKIKDGVCYTVTVLSAWLVTVLLLTLTGYILYCGLPHITWGFLTDCPSLLSGTVGIFPNILNTAYIVLLTLVTVMPLGVGAAVYLNEYAKSKNAVRIIELAAETLSGVPSLIFGLVGMLVFVQICSLGTSVIAGALTLVMITLPTVLRTTQESLKTVPDGYREGALALGCGKWYMIRTVVLPSALEGIVTGCLLSVGKISGESAALLFTAGMANEVMSLLGAVMPNHPGATLTVALYMYAKERGESETAFAIAAILLAFTMVIRFAAKLVAKFFKRKGVA